MIGKKNAKIVSELFPIRIFYSFVYIVQYSNILSNRTVWIHSQIKLSPVDLFYADFFFSIIESTRENHQSSIIKFFSSIFFVRVSCCYLLLYTVMIRRPHNFSCCYFFFFLIWYITKIYRERFLRRRFLDLNLSLICRFLGN